MSSPTQSLVDHLVAASGPKDILSSTPSRTHPDFRDTESDVVLVSRDGVRFLVRQVYLQAASEVFDNMFKALSSNKGGQDIDKDTGLPTIKLEEKELILAVFLKFVVRETKRPNILELEQVENLLRISDKYVAPIVASMACRLLSSFIEKDAPTVFGAAVVYHQLDLARSALAKFRTIPGANATTHYIGSRGSTQVVCRSAESSEPGLIAIPRKYLDRFPPSVFIALLHMQEQFFVATSTSWPSLAKNFTF